jgi:hypothetical protein
MSKPWDIPVPGAEDPTPDPVYLAVGKALSAWEELEVEVAGLFAIFIGAPRTSLEAYAAYASALGFSGRSGLVEKASDQFFVRRPAQDHEATLDNLLCHLRGWSLRRNDIAHGVVREHYRIRTGHSASSRTVYYLVPANYMRKRFRSDYDAPRYMYSSENIEEFRRAFRSLVQPVSDLVDVLSRKPPS